MRRPASAKASARRAVAPSARRRRRQRRRRPPATLVAAEPPQATLLDLVDSLIDSGVSLDGELVLALADVDLVYLRLSTLLAAADRIFGGEGKKKRKK